MKRRSFLSLAASVALRAQESDARVGAAWDQLYQGLELLSANAPSEKIKSAAGFMTRALDQYPSFGNAYYYRSLCLERLGKNFSSDREAAQRNHSEALRDKRDPFTLAVPKIYDNLVHVADKYALVVGISRFQADKGPEPLAFAANDATSFSRVLADPATGRFPPKQVFSLVDDQATTANIKARLNTIATKAKPEDLVVVYISTHGSSRADDLRDVSYLYTYDTDVTSRDEIFGTALPMVEVSQIISTRCLAQRTVIVLDTCHSGASVPGQTVTTPDLDRLRAGAGRYILSSCDKDQSSYENAGHGYFTASLIETLATRNGCIRINELYERVRTEVSAQVKKNHNRAQNPVLARSDDAAEIILGVAPGTAADACTSV